MTDRAVRRPDVGPLAAPLPLAVARPSVDRLSMAGLAALSGVLYVFNLTVSGYANTYYSMAAQAASRSLSAMFFGALDSSGFITLDKPPLATALMGLSVRLFGLSSWSILLPEALAGVATVLVLYLAVKRSFGQPAAVLAGVLMALMPVSVLIFRYDNPDAILALLLVSAAWALGRGLERGAIRWALLAAFLIGLGFLTKYLQAWLVLPAFGLTWLVAAPGTIWRRIGGLAAAGVTVVVSSFWWVAIVELIPAADRPYIGGSTNNSVLELIFGYDGLGRIFGNTPGGSGLSSGLDGLTNLGGGPGAGGPGGGPGGPGPGNGFGFGGEPGLLRLFNNLFAGQIAWLLPAAVLSIAVAVLIHRRSHRTDARLAGYLLWGTWLGVNGLVFSFMSGIIHSYYTVALAPAIAALVGAAAVDLWERRRTSTLAGLSLGAGILATGVTAWAILDRTPGFVPGLGIGIVAISVAAAILVAIPPDSIGPTFARAAIAFALIATLAAPVAYAAETMRTAYADGDPQAGPAAAGQVRGPGASVLAREDDLSRYLVDHRGDARWIVAVTSASDAAGIQLATGEPVMAMGGFTGSDAAPTLDQLKALIRSGELRYVLVGNGPNGIGPGASLDGANRLAWVRTTCQPVALSASQGSLYDCAGAAG
ncbi:MAG TPA: glycosyltransferase family 39 protein [Candidatus Limnocylindrales bacterium]|nr:glycosyltransferase family 39 protein [Candidatus Limnocylindrales bacterium]